LWGTYSGKIRPYVSADVLKDPLFKEKEMARKMGLVSILSVPMSVRERVIGVVNCMTTSRHEFTDTEEKLLTTVANQAAVAIYNTELMVKTQVIREELESRKLIERAKDLLMANRAMSGEEAFRWMQKTIHGFAQVHERGGRSHSADRRILIRFPFVRLPAAGDARPFYIFMVDYPFY
jgi:GAF domain-containing protein